MSSWQERVLIKKGLEQAKKEFKRRYRSAHCRRKETFEKCSILFNLKEGENFNCRNTLSISKLKI